MVLFREQLDRKTIRNMYDRANRKPLTYRMEPQSTIIENKTRKMTYKYIRMARTAVLVREK